MRKAYPILHFVAIPTIVAAIVLLAVAVWAAVQIYPLRLVGLPWPVHIGYGIPHF